MKLTGPELELLDDALQALREKLELQIAKTNDGSEVGLSVRERYRRIKPLSKRLYKRQLRLYTKGGTHG